MKDYPEIFGPRKYVGRDCIAFYKYDGSNLRFGWDKKLGWHQFGTRTQMLDPAGEFGPAVPMFQEQFGDQLAKVFHHKYRCDQAIAFCEWFGPHSFAGQHDVPMLKFLGFPIEHNEPKQLVLIDVNIHKRGLIDPETFIRHFSPVVRTAEVLYQGKLTLQLWQDVLDGKLPVREGIVCKGGEGHTLWRAKIKTRAYLRELQERFPDNWRQYWDWEEK